MLPTPSQTATRFELGVLLRKTPEVNPLKTDLQPFLCGKDYTDFENE
jgi:hypothetical protein